MATPPRTFIVGNWKMNGVGVSLDEADELAAALAADPSPCRVALCPPATLIERMARRLAGTAVELGGQDCHAAATGAHTGDISGEMLRDAGARIVILGHSERRADHHERDADVAVKVEAAVAAGLEPIICVGESLEDRNAGRAADVVRSQVRGSLPTVLGGAAFALAYEPIWAIGTGLTPTLEDIAAIHADLREVLSGLFAHGASVPILYGGSVKPANAHDILHTAEVGGALVGGASLKAADFLGIIRAAG